MRRVVRKKAGRKSQVSVAAEAAILDLDARVAMIQALIPLGLEKIGEELKGSVEELVGPRYQRTGEDRRYYRWGSGQGSVYLADQKVRVRVPRVRDVHANEEIRLPVYERLQEPHAGDRQLLGRLLRGLGCRNYAETAALVPEVFGLSASTVSRRFIRASGQKLQELMERDLSGYDIVGLFLDGKAFADDEIVIAVGITITGDKVILGLIQTASENTAVCREFLASLVERGLHFDHGLYCVVDGAKGLHRAVETVFAGCVVIQRCRWHKRENVLAYLPISQRLVMRRKLQAAYQQRRYNLGLPMRKEEFICPSLYREAVS